MNDLIDVEHDSEAVQFVSMANDTKTAALAMQVRTPYEYEVVSAFLASVKSKFNDVETRRKYLKEPFLIGAKRIDEFFGPPLQFLKEAESTAKQKLLGYESEQRRIAAEEQRKLEEKARKEREALEAKAKAEREKADAEAREIQRQADEAREAGDLAAAATLRHKATVIVEKSEVKAVAALDKAAQVVAPKVEAYIPPVVGQSSRTVWKGRVVNKVLLPDDYKIVDQAMIDKMAQASKGQIPIPGVEFYSEQIMSARSK